jgi:hypothetical protein
LKPSLLETSCLNLRSSSSDKVMLSLPIGRPVVLTLYISSLLWHV